MMTINLRETFFYKLSETLILTLLYKLKLKFNDLQYIKKKKLTFAYTL